MSSQPARHRRLPAPPPALSGSVTTPAPSRPRGQTVPSPLAARPSSPAAPESTAIEEIEELAAAASRAINAHVNASGQCAVCLTPFPCPTACLAEANLAALCEPPARYIPQLVSRAAQPASSHRPQLPIKVNDDLAMLHRVLAGLNRLD